ncbi:MAG: transcription termination/antitermination protein NusA [Cytophagales bacterium]|nr:MAG: transcription termination/antitermination protein NusA [Cytophagales bacterium]TAF61966.1 MAG: transcription termination/antitermination protein NusA [Cytophagales bacterium]
MTTDNAALVESFAEFARDKKIDRPTMIRILEDVFRTLIRKKYNTDDNFEVIINFERGRSDLEIWRSRVIVANNAENFDPQTQIMLSEALKVSDDFEEGEEFNEQIAIDDFGRRLVQTARQTLIQRVRDLEKDLMYQKYKDLVGEIITGEAYQILKREIVVLDSERKELFLPKAEQIFKDRFKKGDPVRAVVSRVDMNSGTPRIILSRTAPTFLEKLFENEIPEVYDGLIAVRRVVREPGERAKVAVESFDDRIDPVGACVGMKGSRIHSIVRELNNENIDVINYTENMELYITRALSPAKISTIKINAENQRASVYLKGDQISLAIGRGGQNIRLAGRLVGLTIDVFREDAAEEEDEDIDLTEFDDSIDEWIIEAFRSVGFDTARSILDSSREDILKRTDLEEETVDFVIDILRKEFE